MILFLDNDPQRAVLAFNRMSEEDRANTIWCRTVEEAIATLRDYCPQLTRVHLEHDLGEEKFANTKREDCGMEIVRFLERTKTSFSFDHVKFIIHTWNDHAGRVMLERLTKLGLYVEWTPFGM